MFIYERDGKLNIMVVGGKPAGEGETPNIVIEPVVDGTTVTAKVTINGEEVSTGSLPVASADTLGGIKVGTGLAIADGVLSVE